MSLRLSWVVLSRELRLSPRSPLVFFAIAMPLLITFLVSSVFGSLFDVSPKLGIVDLGDSAITAAAIERDDIDAVAVSDEDTLRIHVENHDIDAGRALPRGFDEAIVASVQPDLQFFVAGESLAS